MRSSETCGCTLTLTTGSFFTAFGLRESRGRKVGATREREERNTHATFFTWIESTLYGRVGIGMCVLWLFGDCDIFIYCWVVDVVEWTVSLRVRLFIDHSSL